MKRTPFFTLHELAGAKIVPFSGFEMPVQYKSIMDEHRCVRERVGVFDVSHMGEFFVSGPNAAAFVQSVTINDVTKLSPGGVQYSAMCYDDGGIVDDLLVYMLAENRYMIVVNAANIDKDFAWLRSHSIDGAELANRSDEFALLAVQGPKAEETLQKLTSVDLSVISYYHFMEGELAGIPMTISRTGYTGEKGYELYFGPEHADAVWSSLFTAGKPNGIAPIGLGARDSLRLEMGFCLYGNDIDASTNPIEAGLGWITKLSKGDFIGREALLAVKAASPKRKLVGLKFSEKVIPRHGYTIEQDGTPIGVVTSGTFSPTLSLGIALGYVEFAYSPLGTTLQVDIRGKKTNAVVSAIPFTQR